MTWVQVPGAIVVIWLENHVSWSAQRLCTEKICDKCPETKTDM